MNQTETESICSEKSYKQMGKAVGDEKLLPLDLSSKTSSPTSFPSSISLNHRERLEIARRRDKIAKLIDVLQKNGKNSVSVFVIERNSQEPISPSSIASNLSTFANWGLLIPSQNRKRYRIQPNFYEKYIQNLSKQVPFPDKFKKCPRYRWFRRLADNTVICDDFCRSVCRNYALCYASKMMIKTQDGRS